MKRLLLPLKLTTEAIWVAGKVARKARDTLRKVRGKGDAGPQAGAPGAGAGRAGAAKMPSGVATPDQVRGGRSAPEGGFEIGARVVILHAAEHMGRGVPERAIGRIAQTHPEGDGSYDFLFYGDDGLPILISGVAAEGLRSL